MKRTIIIEGFDFWVIISNNYLYINPKYWVKWTAALIVSFLSKNKIGDVIQVI